jgi:hypothetical protein
MDDDFGVVFGFFFFCLTSKGKGDKTPIKDQWQNHHRGDIKGRL